MHEDKSIPGFTSREQIIDLADEYARAARSEIFNGRKGQPVSRAPARLLAIHAIELYLNAAALGTGLTPQAIRLMQHDLRARVELLQAILRLRKRTYDHLAVLTTNREYLVTRYRPEVLGTLSELNRLIATMDEVGQKCRTVGALDTAPKSIARLKASA